MLHTARYFALTLMPLVIIIAFATAACGSENGTETEAIVIIDESHDGDVIALSSSQILRVKLPSADPSEGTYWEVKELDWNALGRLGIAGFNPSEDGSQGIWVSDFTPISRSTSLLVLAYGPWIQGSDQPTERTYQVSVVVS